MPNFGPRHGQWVKFKVLINIPGAHKTDSGHYVGIFNRAGTYSQISHNDGTDKAVHAPCIMLVDPDGFNVPKIVKGEFLGNWKFDLGDVSDLQPIADRKDIPAERLKHLPDDWQPKL